MDALIGALQWPAMVATLAAAWLVASQSKRKRARTTPSRRRPFDAGQDPPAGAPYDGSMPTEETMFEAFVTGPVGTVNLALVRRCQDCARTTSAEGCAGFGSGCLALARAEARDREEIEAASRWTPRRV